MICPSGTQKCLKSGENVQKIQYRPDWFFSAVPSGFMGIFPEGLFLVPVLNYPQQRTCSPSSLVNRRFAPWTGRWARGSCRSRRAQHVGLLLLLAFAAVFVLGLSGNPGVQR